MADRSRQQMMDAVSPEPCPVCDGTPRVLVAIRHPVMRRFAAELLARECGCWASDDVAAGEMLASAIDRFRPDLLVVDARSEEHTSELQSLMRNSYAGFFLHKKKTKKKKQQT